MSEVLPFNQWVESDEAVGLEGLDKVQAYGDHYRYNKFASGSFNEREAAQVDLELFNLARNSGLVDAEDDEVAQQQFFTRPEAPVSDEDLASVVAQKFYDKQEGEDEVRAYLAARNTEGIDDTLLSERAEAAAPFVTKESLAGAKRSAALRGDRPFFVEQDEDGNLDVEFDPNLEESTLTDERISQIAREQGIDSRFLPAIKAQLQAPSGLTASRAKVVRNAELRNILNDTEDEDLKFYRDRVFGLVSSGDYEGAAKAAEDAVHGPLSRQFSRADIVNGLVDYAKYAANSDHPEILSTGEVAMPAVLHSRAEEFDAAVDALDLTEEQKALTKLGREAKMEAMTGQFHVLASSFGGTEYTSHYEAGKAAGKTDTAIVEEWFSQEDNYRKAQQAAQGVFIGTVEGFGGLILYPMSLAGSEDARKTVGSMMKNEAERQQYAAMFGEKLGIGYSIVRTAPSVVADIALSIPTGGAAGGLAAGTRWTMRQGAKLAFRQSLSSGTKAATGAALKTGAAGSVANALKLTGDDFAKKLATFTKTSVAIAPTAFNRSAGATYTSVYSSLQSQHPDWSDQQIREAAYGHAVVSGAITVGITSAFNGLAQAFPKYFGAGVEEWATGRGGSLTIRQLRTAYTKLASVPHQIPSAVRNYIKLDSFEEFVGSVAKEGMRNSWLKHAARQVGSEAFEEGLDEFVNGWRQSAFLNEDTNLLEHLKAAGHAAVIGGVFGAGGAIQEGGVRSSVSDREFRKFEQGAFATVADGLEQGGDVESATVLRGLIARSRSNRTEVTRQLETLGHFASRQESRVAQVTRPYEKILSADPRVPSGLQRELAKAEEWIAQYEGIDPAKLTNRQRVNLAAARIYQRRLTDTFNAAEQAAIEGQPTVSRPESAVTDEDGTVVAHDRGTKHRSFADKFTADTPEEAADAISRLNEEISRLSSRGDEATPFQKERVNHLTTQRDALETKFAPVDEPGAPKKSRRSTPKVSKIEAQLRSTESGLAALRRLERSNPAVTNTPAHRARKIALRSRRRALREAIANDASSARRPISWRQYPVEKIAEGFVPDPNAKDGIFLGSLALDDVSVFDPVTNQTFDPNIEPEAALEAIEKASKEKRKLDEATIKKIEKGSSVTEAELESLATEDPDVQYAEVFEGLQELVEALNPSFEQDSDSTNPDAVAKVRALEIAKTHSIAKDVKDTVALIPAEAEGVEESVEAIANEVAADDAGPEPRTAKYTVEGTKLVLVVREDGVRVLDNGTQQASFPATSFPEADAIARKVLDDSGNDPAKVERVESETDPRTETEAAVAAGDTAPIEEAAGEPATPPTAAVDQTVTDAEAELIAAELESITTGTPTTEILERKIEEEKRKVSVVNDIVPLLSTTPAKGYTPVYRGGPVAIKGFDPEKHKIATPSSPHYIKGEVTVLSLSTGKPLKREVIKLSGDTTTLYDANGAPQFLRPEDKALFYDLLERGVKPEPRSFHDGTYSLGSHSQYYLNPFLRTLQNEVILRYPPVEAPPSAMFKTDPDPSLQEQSILYKYVVISRDGRDPAALRDGLEARLEELTNSLQGTRKSREEAALERASAEVSAALSALDEASGIHTGHVENNIQYYDALQKKAHATARLQHRIHLLDLANKRLESVTPTSEFTGSKAVATEGEVEAFRNMVRASEVAVSDAEKQLDGVSAELDALTDPRTLPDLSELEKASDAAHRKLADLTSKIKGKDFSAASIRMRISEIQDILESSPSDTKLTIEFDPRGVPVSSRAQRRLDEIHKDHHRGLRAAARQSKLSRAGRTVNLSIPIVERVVENEDGTTTTIQEVVFTNEPLAMAEARNLGYEIKVPAKYRPEGSKRNPSIKVSGDGYVADVFHPLKNRWVRSPGDLLEYGNDEAYVPSEVRHSARSKYVGALPPVQYADLPHLGNTPLNITADRVQSVYGNPDNDEGLPYTEEERQSIADAEGISVDEVPLFRPVTPNASDEPGKRAVGRDRLGGPDAEYLTGAADFFDGIFGGDRRAAPRNRTNRVRRAAEKEFNETVAPLRAQLSQLRKLQDGERVATNPVVPAELAESLGLSVFTQDGAGVEVNEAELDTLIAKADADVQAALADLTAAQKEEQSARTKQEREARTLELRVQEITAALEEHVSGRAPRGSKKYLSDREAATESLAEARVNLQEAVDKGRAESTLRKKRAAVTRAEAALVRVEENAPKAFTNHFDKKVGLEKELDKARAAVANQRRGFKVETREAYRTALLRTDEGAAEELSKAAKDLDESVQAELAVEVAEDRLSRAQARAGGLTVVQSTMEEARQSLIDPESGDQIVPANLEELITSLTNKIKDAQRRGRQVVAEAESEFDEAVADVTGTGQHLHPDVAALLELVDKSGGKWEDARTVSLLLYTQEVREFGVALRLLNKNNDGVDPVSWFQKYLKTFSPDARKDFMSYIRSRHQSAVAREFTTDEAVSFILEAPEVFARGDVAKKLRAWAKRKRHPDQLTVKQLQSFVSSEIGMPELAGVLRAHLDAEVKADVDDAFYIKNYVDSLLNDLTPEPGRTTRWVRKPHDTPTPPSFRGVLRTMYRRYKDAIRTRTTPRFESIDSSATDEDGNAIIGGVDAELVASIEEAWKDQRAAQLGSELAQTEFFITVLRSIKKSQPAQESLRRLAAEIGVRDVNDRPLEEIWMATHERLFHDPVTMELLNPEMQSVVRNLYRAGLRTSTDFGSSEALFDIIDENRQGYTRRIRQAGIDIDDPVTNGLPLGSQVKRLAEWVVANDTVMSQGDRQVLQGVVAYLNATGDWPAISFLSRPEAAYSLFTGAYSPEGKTIYLNLTKLDRFHHETLTRGLLRHVLQDSKKFPQAAKDLKALGAKVIERFPNTEQLITQSLAPEQDIVEGEERAVRFAMNDPVVYETVSRTNPSFSRRLTSAIANVLGLSSPVAKQRLTPYTKPAIGQVWGSEPKHRRHAPAAAGVTESAVDILNRVSPPGISIEVSEDHDQPAWVRTTAPTKVFVNVAAVEAHTQDLSPEGKEQVLRSLLNHELTHIASLNTLTDEDRAAILADMSDKDWAAVRSRVPAGSGSVEVAEEFLRMKVEQASYGLDSDEFIQSVLNYGTGLRARVVRYVQTFLNKLRDAFTNRPSIRTAVHIDRVQAALAEIQRGGLPLRPVPTNDILGHRAALDELADGTERTFFSVPLFSTDPGHAGWWSRINRRREIRRELREIDNHVAYERNAMEGLIKDFHRKVRDAANRGTVIDTRQINAALGSTDAYLTEQQEDKLRAARQADVAAKMSQDDIKTRHLARVQSEQRAAVVRRVAEQAAALTTIKRADDKLANDIKNFRDNITLMSRDVGQIHDGGSMKAVFDDRAEVHLIRSYEFFNSRAWREAARWSKDDKGVKGYEDVKFNSLRSQAIKDIQDWHARKHNKSIDGKTAWRLLNSWLHELASGKPEVMNLNTLTKTGTLFKSKEDIPAGVRALLGEKSALDSAANTTVKLATYLAKHDAAKNTRQLLLGNEWAFDRPDAVPGVELVPLWTSVQGDTEYESLQGLFTRPEDKVLIEDTLSTVLPTRGEEGDSFARMAANGTKRFFGASLTLKTLFSVGFFTRNEGSNSFFLLPMQGHWGAAFGFAGFYGKGRQASTIAWGGLGGRFAEGKEEYTLELLRNGIIHDDVTAGLLKDLSGRSDVIGTNLQDDVNEFANGGKPKGWMAKAITRIAKTQGLSGKALETVLSGKAGSDRIVSFLTKINEVIDAKAKIQLYEFELDTLKAARDETGGTQSDEELQRKAANKVHRTMQGHSQVYDSVRRLAGSNVGMLIAPFARFKSEMARVVANTPRLVLEEWKEGVAIGSPTLKKRAIKRAVSFAAVNAAWTSILVSLFGALFDGIDEDRTIGEGGFTSLKGEVGKTLRMGLPRWSRNHTIFARRNNDGTITTFDMTYYNPLSLLHDPVKALIDRTNTDGVDAGLSAFIDAMLTDFVGEGIGPGAVRQILDNADDYGQEVFLPTDSFETKASKIIGHYLENAMKPSGLSKAEQVYDAVTRKDKAVDGDRFYDAGNIIIGELIGVRPRDYVESEMMKKSARNTKLQLDQVQRLLSPLNSPSFKTEDEIKDSVHAYNEAYVELWKQHRRNAASWAEFSGNEKARIDYANRMVDAGHSKDRTRKAIISGVLDRFVRSRNGLENIFRAAQTPGAEGGEARTQAATDAMLESPRLIPLTD